MVPLMKTTIFILALVMSLPSFAMMIKGKVVDTSGNPIMGALVRVKETNDAQTTGIRGTFNFSFTTKATDVVVIVVNSSGFDEKKISLPYKADEMVDMGVITLGVMIDDEAEAFTPEDFARLAPADLEAQVALLLSVDLFSVTSGEARDFNSYQEEMQDLPAFENISKKELKQLQSMITYLKGKLPSDHNPNELLISVLVLSEEDRTIYGYEVIYENSEEVECNQIYSSQGDLLSQSCSSL